MRSWLFRIGHQFRMSGLKSGMSGSGGVEGLNNVAGGVIYVIGTTGVGKSKLGVDLAHAFESEVVSADSMQVYEGADVATAKVTDEEMDGVKHHCLSIVPLTEGKFTVQDYLKTAAPIVSGLQEQGKVPVVVGGTAYYIEALAFSSLIDASIPSAASQGLGSAVSDDSESDSEEPVRKKPHKINPDVGAIAAVKAAVERGIGKESGIDVDAVNAAAQGGAHSLLALLDPPSAGKLHPNDRRKVARALEMWAVSGKPRSELVAEAAAAAGSEPRWRSLFVWLDAPANVLDERLDRRVDGMLKAGLLEELSTVIAALKAQTPTGELDPTRGVLQSIGFKEFQPYLDAVEAHGSENTKKLAAPLAEGVSALQAVTRRYARKQLRYLRNRLMRRISGASDGSAAVIRLDTSNVAEWKTTVQEPAVAAAKAWVKGEPFPDPSIVLNPGSLVSASSQTEGWKMIHCDICGKDVHGDHEWKIHLNTRAHRRAVKKGRQMDLRREAKQASSSEGVPEPSGGDDRQEK